MSEPPITTQVGRDLYDAVEPLTFADEQLQWPLAHYLDSLGEIMEQVAKLVRTDEDGNDGWSAFGDPQRCPVEFLFTLAQWAGTRYPRRMPEADLRNFIGPYAPGIWRGTKRALLESVRRYITPDTTIYFEERADGNPYLLRIFTFTYNTLNEQAIRRELRDNVPAGLVLEYEVRVGQTYGMLRDRCATYQDVKDAYPTYNDVRAEAPLP